MRRKSSRRVAPNRNCAAMSPLMSGVLKYAARNSLSVGGLSGERGLLPPLHPATTTDEASTSAVASVVRMGSARPAGRTLRRAEVNLADDLFSRLGLRARDQR